MKAIIKSTTKDTFSQSELDATFDDGKVAVTLVLKDPKKALKGLTPAQVADRVKAAIDVPGSSLVVDIYAGPGEDVANVEED